VSDGFVCDGCWRWTHLTLMVGEPLMAALEAEARRRLAERGLPARTGAAPRPAGSARPLDTAAIKARVEATKAKQSQDPPAPRPARTPLGADPHPDIPF